VQSFESLYGTNLILWANPYPAVPVAPLDGGALNAISATLGWGSYTDSINQGVENLNAEINEVTAACPNTQIILAGFSQGAQVVGNVYESLDSSQLAAVSKAVLFADPLFNPALPVNRGDFNSDMRGVLAHPASRMRSAFPSPARVLSYCHKNDAVCQGFISFRPFAVNSAAAHGTYWQTDGTSPAYTTLAAQACFNGVTPASDAGKEAHAHSAPKAAIAPTAFLEPVAAVQAGQTFTISGAESYSSDASNPNLTYNWDLADSGTFTPSTNPVVSTSYSSPGTYTVALQVSDGATLSSVVTTTITVAGTSTGVPNAATSVTQQLSGSTLTVSWKAPTSGAVTDGYEVYSDSGIPLVDISGSGGGSVALPSDAAPAQVDIVAVNTDGEGATATDTTNASVTDVPLTLDGSSASASVSGGADVDFSFYATAGQAFYFDGFVTTQSGDGTDLSLYDPSNNNIASNVVRALTEEQTFMDTEVASVTGVYTLQLQPPSGDTGTVIVTGSSQFTTGAAALNGATIDVVLPTQASAPAIALTFTAEAGQVIYVNGVTDPSSGVFFTDLGLFDGGSVPVALGAGFTQSAEQNLINPVIAPITNTYTLYINQPPAASGTLTLNIENQTINATAIVNGPQLPVDISSPNTGMPVAVHFTASAGTTIYINGQVTSTSGAQFQELLVSPTGATVQNKSGQDDAGAISQGAYREFVYPSSLPSTGVYTLYLAPPAADTGTVNIQVLTYTKVTLTGDGAATSITTTATSPGVQDEISIDTTAGSPLTINATLLGSSSDPPGAVLIDPLGNTDDLFLEGGGTQMLADVPSTVAGIYTLLIQTPTDAYGTNTFKIYESYITATATVNGASVPVSIPSADTGKDAKIYFNATAGQDISVNGSFTFDSEVTIYDPAGNYWYYTAVSPSSPLSIAGGLTVFGKYEILLQSATQTGSVTIKVSTISNAARAHTSLHSVLP
jgi:hypothetical protein